MYFPGFASNLMVLALKGAGLITDAFPPSMADLNASTLKGNCALFTEIITKPKKNYVL